jgi:hypothetical protein
MRTAAAWRCVRKTAQIKKSHSGRSLANNAWISRSHLYPDSFRLARF